MKADGELGSGSDREPEELRTILRQWKVPGPPLEIEEQLRRTFRGRRSKRRRTVWLAVAASLALVLAYAVRPLGRPAPPLVAERPAPVAPPASPASTVEPNRVETRGPVHASRARARPARAARPARSEVLVEPGQAELLRQLARQLRGTRQAPPGASLPRIEVMPANAPAGPILETQARDDVLEYRAHWEKVGSEWPFVHRSL